MMNDVRNIFKRNPQNPLINPEDYPGVLQIFNPSPVRYKNKTILLVSMLYAKTDHGGETRVAQSDDGIHFTIADSSFINLDKTRFPYNIIGHHIIDNRVTKIDDTYYILTPVGTTDFDGPATILGKTKDFQKYELMDVITLPRNRGASLFPEKINGKYYKLDRPGGGKGSFGAIWISSSPDLINWGSFKPVIRPFNSWNWEKIGPTPPIKTQKGWLVLIHGVVTPAGGTRYSIGAILLDLNNPWEVIGQTYSPLLEAEEEYEINGMSANTVFPCGAIADHDKDELKLYYGAADTRICLATASISQVVNACIDEL